MAAAGTQAARVAPAPTVAPARSPGRVVELDLLRCAAIVLVLLHHFPPRPWCMKFGWTGVDLFFVLSGYLVSGLLFAEQRVRGSVDAARFLVRRGFKIYPAFWLMIAASVVWLYATGRPPRALAVADELAFVQNYGPGVWVHTWSLAVEEHFYLLVAAGFWWWQRRQPAIDTRAATRWIIAFFVSCFVARVATVLLVPTRFKLTVYGTHMRIDALAFGAMIAWLRDRHAEVLSRWIGTRRALVPIVGTVALAIVFVAPQPHAWVHTAGVTLLYVGYGTWLLWVLDRVDRAPIARPSLPVRAAVVVGQASYGIYLWHLLVADVLATAAPRLFSVGPTAIAVALIAGIVLTKLIETPFLRLRERLVPRRA